MGLNIQYVPNLATAIDPVADFLQTSIEGADLFQREYVIVPTAGVKAWLMPELARRFGARPGFSDGVVANIEVGYVGMLNRFIAPDRVMSDDPWSIDRMTARLLTIFSQNPNHLYYEELIERCGGPLRAARRMADRFDRYAVRRPGMIVAWENGSPILTAESSTEVLDNEYVMRALSNEQMPQFELWRELRAAIDQPSWPMVTAQLLDSIANGTKIEGVPVRLLVVGLQSLSLQNLRVLEALATVSDVRVFLVHPSPGLERHWSNELATLPLTSGVVPLRETNFVIPEGVDSLVASWSRGSYELQKVLASQGIRPSFAQAIQNASDTLLHRLQNTVAFDLAAVPGTLDASDHSLLIHRCHHISRQVEVAHTALLHAFNELEDLQPDEVVILCPNIESAAPYLEAIFDRPVKVSSGRTIKIPLVVGDRSLREVSDGADLLNTLLAVTMGRFSVDDVMGLATSSLVRKQFNVSTDSVALWYRIADRARVRWGLDAQQRAHAGLNAPQENAHTWKAAIERTLLGATLSDQAPAIELGGVVPLTDFEVSDIPAVAQLIAILDVLGNLEVQTHIPQTVGRSCDMVQEALISLAGSTDPELEAALEALDHVRFSMGGEESASIPVAFAEFADVLTERLTASPGRQPLRTGAVTASSTIPLRSVPFRVICVLGVDDGSLSLGESEGDDLVDAQQFVGDPDARAEQRRVLLDAVMAAKERLIITCNGRSIKNNTPIPLVTPLAEFVDFCGRHGVENRKSRDGEDCSQIEVIHPRHAASEKNFVKGGVIGDRIWSPDDSLRSLAEAIREHRIDEGAVLQGGLFNVERQQIVELADLERAFVNPLDLFLSRTLRVNTYREDLRPDDATLPLASKNFKEVARSFLDGLLAEGIGFDVNKWRQAIRLTGILPVGAFGEAELLTAESLARSFVDKANEKGFHLVDLETIDIELRLADKSLVRCSLPGVDLHADVPALVFTSFKDDFDASYWSDKRALAVRLLALIAAGSPVECVWAIHQKDKKTNPAIGQVRKMPLSVKSPIENSLERMATLAEMYYIAQSTPIGRFNGAVHKLSVDRDSARKTFDEFVRSDRYSNSGECLCFGADPDFDVVCAPGGILEQYWALAEAVLQIAPGTNQGVYAIS
jgi:exodeoxyribonuclease V gamma subunit